MDTFDVVKLVFIGVLVVIFVVDCSNHVKFSKRCNAMDGVVIHQHYAQDVCVKVGNLLSAR